MKYTVVWKPAAERLLMEIWMRAKDLDAVAQAADSLDVILSTNAELQGEPLGIYFEASAADRQARVLAVWRTDRR